MFWIIIMAFVVLMALAIMIYMLPSDPAVKAKKKKEKEKRLVLTPDPAAVEKAKVRKLTQQVRHVVVFAGLLEEKDMAFGELLP